MIDDKTKPLIKDNVRRIRDRIASACNKAGRNESEVKLIAITKYVTADVAALLLAQGVTSWGESRPQLLWEKAKQVQGVEWHLVGHLQRNKVAETIQHCQWIHSVDSERLLQAIETEAGKQKKIINVLLEIHLSGEAAKQGFTVEEIPAVLAKCSSFQNLRIQGLMTMAALNSTSQAAQATFAQLRQLRDTWNPLLQPPHKLSELSMGMTNDFEEAIAEGATMLRIGSALFEGLNQETH